MSEYENYVGKAHMAMSAAAEMGGKVTRADYLAEAQVHATLAASPTGWAQAGMLPDDEAEHDVDACTGCEFCTPVVRSERADEVGA